MEITLHVLSISVFTPLANQTAPSFTCLVDKSLLQVVEAVLQAHWFRSLERTPRLTLEF